MPLFVLSCCQQGHAGSKPCCNKILHFLSSVPANTDWLIYVAVKWLLRTTYVTAMPLGVIIKYLLYSCCCFYCNLKIRCTAGGSAGIGASPSASVTTDCEQWELIIDRHCYSAVRLTGKLWCSCKSFFWMYTSVVCCMHFNRLLTVFLL